MRRIGLFTAIGLSLINSGVTALATSGAPNWNLSLVATPTNPQYISTPDLAFDHYGTPSVTYSFINNSIASNSVQHAQMTSLGLWSTRELANGQGLGIRTAIAFDRSERPAIAWTNLDQSIKGQFNYTANQNVAVNSNEIRPILNLNYDLAGNLRGMYGGISAGDFSSISMSGTTFSSAPMASIPGLTTVYNADMTTDQRGLRQIAVRALASGTQTLSLLSEPAGGPWASMTLATADAVDGVSIATDPNDGRIAVAYTTWNSTSNTSKLIYSKFNGSTIATTEVLSFNTFRYQDVSLAFDRSDGRPAIAFERRVNSTSAQEMWYAFLNASSVWQTSLIDATVSLDAQESNMPRGPALAFDDYGTSWPAVAYIDANGALNVAFDPPAPEPAAIALLPVIALILRRRR